MKGLLHAIVAGLISGLLSPICFLSSFLSGGIAIGSYLQYSLDESLSIKEVFYIGLVCGLTAGLSAIVLWYGIFLRLERTFLSLFSVLTLERIQEQVANDLWLYALLHLIVCPLLSICGAFFSERLYARDY